MNGQFKVGDVAILRNDLSFTVDPEIKALEGEEVQVAGPLRRWNLNTGPFYGYMVSHLSCDDFFCAPHELRRRPPKSTGEERIRAMFDTSPVDRRKPVTAWQVQYDTALAFYVAILDQQGMRAKHRRVKSGRGKANLDNISLNALVQFVKLNSSRSNRMPTVHCYGAASRLLPESINSAPTCGFQVHLQLKEDLHLPRFEICKNGIDALAIIFERVIRDHNSADNGADLRPSFGHYGFSILGWGAESARGAKSIEFRQFLKVNCNWMNHCVNQCGSLPLLLTGSSISCPYRCSNSPDCSKCISPKRGNRFQQLAIPNWGGQGQGQQKPNAAAAYKCPATTVHCEDIQAHRNSLILHFGIVA